MPSGAIIIWAGTIASIPSGWIICDGNKGTPNLLAKFVEGVATAATNPGTTGGATAKTTAGHTHTHAVTNLTATAASDVAGAKGLVANGTVREVGDTSSQTDSIADIRPLFYDVAFLRKS